MSREQVMKELLQRRARRDAGHQLAGERWSWLFDDLSYAWRTAQADAVLAYENWRELPGRDAYAVYRAAQDRADKAQDALEARAAALRAAMPDGTRSPAELRWLA